ncbi:ectonucleotide pyrophosphatase/phosphodiesterase [Pedobacter sp. MC2016-05]|uniref:ectonucleotide pyrophosphatase/phosphodiesterase n=1 Tax=Pedobacter sp. MC2016-05 TaxID=2994474 RepID=UPI0022478819|nr:ectonucleotide pyrophosphatase/phosphodiesterase [Pedobacter sp. MC2016-05]MCX2473771.1 ectonucleotide pyrophosphatase/phosphodiesterase [Pedobacter sp. MC2016-05]
MKTPILKILLLLSCCSISVFGQKDSKRVLIIGLDGFSTEGFKVAKHPNIDQLFANGVISLTTRPVMPSVTLPNWTSHLTGSGPEEHGITANDWTLQKHLLPPLQTDSDDYYPSIFKVLKEDLPKSRIGYYYNWKELINPINKKYLDEVSFEENDQYSQNYDKAFNFLLENRVHPTLVFLYSVHTDHAGHGYGWMTDPYIKAIEEADLAIGKLLDRLKSADLYKGTHFMLITDHGGINKGHGGVSRSEMEIPWAITGPKIKTKGLTNIYNSNKNTSLVLARIFGIRKLPTVWTGEIPEDIFR